MPVYWTPAWVSVEAPSREEALALLPQDWHDDEAPVEVEGADIYVGYLRPERMEEGDPTEAEQEAIDESRSIASRVGFAPSPAQILARKGLPC